MATSGSGTLYPNNGTYSCELRYSWTRDSSGVVSWSATITGVDGDTGTYASSPCWTSFYLRGGNNSQGNLTGDLTSYCSSCSQCATYYQGRILWQTTQSGTINMGSGGGTLKLGYYGQRNGSNTSEDYLTWSVDPTYVRPSAPSITILNRYAESAKFRVSISSYGNPSSGYIEAAILGSNTYGAPYRYNTSQNNTSADITVDNSKSGSLTIRSNTQYWYGAYVTNNKTTPRNTVAGQFYTLPANPVAQSFTQTGETSATFTVTDNSYGTAQSIILQYRYKKSGASSYGSWTDAGASGNQQTNTVNLTGLEAGEAYDIQIRAKAGSSDYSNAVTYENAFTILKTTISIPNATYQYNPNLGPDGCTGVFDYAISSHGGENSFDIHYELTRNDTSTSVTGTFSNKPASGTFSLDLERGISYTLEVWVGTSGEKTTYNFTTPDFNPTLVLDSASKDARGNVMSLNIHGSLGIGMTSGTISQTIKLYNSVTNTWSNDVGGTTTSAINTASYNKTMTFTHSGSATARSLVYPVYTKIKWIFVVENNNNLSITKEIITELPPFIGGKVLPGTGGQKLNVIGTAIKDTTGTLSSLRYNWPIVTIK